MSQISPYLTAKSLEESIMSMLSGIDVYSLESQAAREIALLKKQLTEVRLHARDYELSETREDQLRNLKSGRRRLEDVRKYILAISEYNIFSSVDVAQLTAQTELISEHLV